MYSRVSLTICIIVVVLLILLNIFAYAMVNSYRYNIESLNRSIDTKSIKYLKELDDTLSFITNKLEYFRKINKSIDYLKENEHENITILTLYIHQANIYITILLDKIQYIIHTTRNMETSKKMYTLYDTLDRLWQILHKLEQAIISSNEGEFRFYIDRASVFREITNRISRFSEYNMISSIEHGEIVSLDTLLDQLEI